MDSKISLSSDKKEETTQYEKTVPVNEVPKTNLGTNPSTSSSNNTVSPNTTTTTTTTTKLTVRKRLTRRQRGGVSRIQHLPTTRKKNRVTLPTPLHEKSLVLRLLHIVKLQNPSLEDSKDTNYTPPYSLGFILDDYIKKGIENITKDFILLNKAKPEPSEYSSFLMPENRPKNRYRDILCLENGRIKIKNHTTDYIHANYVKTPKSEKAFICTQGPTNRSILDMWKMLIQEEVEYIIMLCQFEENGIKKCSKYYPYQLKETMTFESAYYIINEKINDNPDPNVRDITLKVFIEGTSLSRKIRHIQYLNWPDKGVPELSDTIINILDIVKNSTKPVVVHCSAGIGRTGTFVLIQNIMERVYGTDNNKKETTLDIVKEMRAQRYGVVQTDFQYIFAHRIVLEHYIKTKKIDVEAHKDLAKWILTYKKIHEKYVTTCKPTKTGTVEEEA
uniref:Tyrosine-protein phosphatase domain-containing protein n=1 Tax=Parastrongyloides trichosuri TaxID=131310 RepID=A0A0N4ZG16_PARTI